MKYFSLSPATDVDAPVYFEALQEKLNDDSIKNIAITGSYGCGKSSILDSYFAKHNEHKKLNVSLANFCESETTPEDEKKIEELILQQLYYQLSHKSIPFSGFKKICHRKKKSQYLIAISIIIWLLSLVRIPSIFNLINQNIQTISVSGFLEFINNISWFLISLNFITLGVFSIGLFFVIKEFVRIIQKGQIKRVAMKSAQVDLSEESALNKHIDELIYFFEATDNKIVVIEDLDRFNSIALFAKLREVNFLINNSPKVSPTVKFIYAIRDEVFINNFNRTKFFDFILPIVPVINTTNSGDILRGYLKDDNSISETYINDVSLYIHDLRLLKNIVNEYHIYSGVINKNKKKRSVSLFSIILYKNLFPKEFGLEHSGKGLLNKVFNKKKQEIYNNLIDENKTKIKTLSAEKEEINTATILGEVKLRDEYLIEILKSHSNVVSICNHDIKTMATNRDSFNTLLINPQIKVPRPVGINNFEDRALDFDAIQTKVHPTLTYAQRLDLINKGCDGRISEIDKNIITLKNKVSAIERYKLIELIRQYQDSTWKNTLFENKEDSFSPEYELLALLIRKGYIDENYQLYMSYFYEGALCLSDFEFLLNVKNNEGDNFNTEIKNVNELFSRISVDEYEYEAALNMGLICYLLKKYDYKEEKRLDLLLIQFSDIENVFEKCILPLIDRLKNNKRDLQKFIELLVEKYHPSIWQSIEERSYDSATKDDFLRLFLFLSSEKIKALNSSSENESLKNYLSTKENFIEAFSSAEEIGDVMKLIKALNIKFQNLTFKRYENNQIFNFIYTNCFYSFNVDMLHLMLFYKYSISEIEYNELFYKQNYTCILETTDDVLNNYVNSNFDIYIEDIYLELEAPQDESENAIASFIEQLSDEKNANTLFSVLSKISTQIEDIEEFGNNEKWSLFFETDCVEPNWYNIIEYFKYKDNSINNTITNWLNNKDVIEVLTLDALVDEDFAEEDQDKITSFMTQLIENDKLVLGSYEKLLYSFSYAFSKISLDELSPDKISKLVELGRIEYNKHHYDLLLNMELISDLFLFTTRNISKFVESYSEYDFDLELHKKILSSNGVNSSYKKSIIELISVENIQDSSLASIIGNIVLNTQEEFVANNKISAIICNCNNLELKLSLFDKFISKFEFHEIDIILASLGGVYEQATELRRKPTWEKNEINLSIAQKLKNTEYFSSYSIDEKNNEIKIVVRYF